MDGLAPVLPPFCPHFSGGRQFVRAVLLLATQWSTSQLRLAPFCDKTSLTGTGSISHPAIELPIPLARFSAVPQDAVWHAAARPTRCGPR